jgi:heme-degrading monooxygenase HmoA
LQRTREAFQRLTPIRDDYATRPIWEGFDWSRCAAEADVDEVYLVVFRSVRREDADLDRLVAYDDHAHAEAAEASGFLHYFKGQATEGRECLSFCLWESPEQGKAAARGSAHSEAAALVDEAYESYELERYLLKKRGVGRQRQFVFERLRE